MLTNIKNPKISIITVCYNAADTLAYTIESVIKQTYDNIEYIIIDGGSRDNTLDIIKSYSDYITYWLSEPDKGVYDAMNKGISCANGEWIAFMNSGDRYASNDIIENIFCTNVDSNINVIYGQTIMHFKWGTYRVIPDNPPTFKSIICHQSVFVRTNIQKAYYFNIGFKYVADNDMLMRILRDYPNAFHYFPSPIAEYDGVVGLSSNFYTTESERDKLKESVSYREIIRRKIITALPSPLEFMLRKVYYALNPRYKRMK